MWWLLTLEYGNSLRWVYFRLIFNTRSAWIIEQIGPILIYFASSTSGNNFLVSCVTMISMPYLWWGLNTTILCIGFVMGSNNERFEARCLLNKATSRNTRDASQSLSTINFAFKIKFRLSNENCLKLNRAHWLSPLKISSAQLMIDAPAQSIKSDARANFCSRAICQLQLELKFCVNPTSSFLPQRCLVIVDRGQQLAGCPHVLKG